MSLIEPEFEYTEPLRRRFERDGFLIFPAFLTTEGLARCQRECDALLERRHPDRPAEMIISAHVRDRWLFELACEPKLLDIVEAHIGPNILLWSTHLLCKPPGAGRSIPWHQDAPYFHLRGICPPTLWIAFDDIDEDNGGLAVLPGMHTHGLFPTVDSGRTDFEKELAIEGIAPGIDPVYYHLRAGQLAMHHPRMPHWSPPNRSNRWRRVVTASYINADAELATRTYSDYQTNEPFERRFYLVRGEAPTGRTYARAPEGFPEANPQPHRKADSAIGMTPS
jgi:hypothetical protein